MANGVATAPLGAEYAMQAVAEANGHPAAATAEAQPTAEAPAADAAAAAAAAAAGEPERKRRHKWGPPAAGEFANEEQKPKKRRSRWESSTDIVLATSKAGQIIIPGQLPKEVTICGGMKVGEACVQLSWGRLAWGGGCQLLRRCSRCSTRHTSVPFLQA
jgi:hypothetical protein